MTASAAAADSPDGADSSFRWAAGSQPGSGWTARPGSDASPSTRDSHLRVALGRPRVAVKWKAYPGGHGRIRLDQAPAVGIVAGSTTARVLVGDNLRMDWTAEIAPRSRRLEIRASLTNQGRTAIHIDGVDVLDAELDLGPGIRGWSTYRNGFQSWSGTYTLRDGEADKDLPFSLLRRTTTDPFEASPTAPGVHRSDLVITTTNLSAGTSIGGTSTRSDTAFVAFTTICPRDGRPGRFQASVLDGRLLEPGATWELPPVSILASSDGLDLLEASLDLLGEAMQARIPERSPVGWCSWYRYFTKVTADDVSSNLAAMQERPDRTRIDYVQIDDGYQAAIGDWTTPSPGFPAGVAALVPEIAATGRRAGLWIAPFLADPDSALATGNQRWLLKNEKGRPVPAILNPAWSWKRPMYALDMSHPGVQEWLGDLVSHVVHTWGFDVLKLDFLYAAALRGRRYDETMTRAAATRKGLEVIREAAGQDAFLIGCGCPLGPAIGIVDAMRIGPDVEPRWRSRVARRVQRDRHGIGTVHALRNVMTRSPMHRRLWLNDPDCLMVRRSDTELTDNEIETLATTLGVTDGMIVVSDDLAALDDESWADLDRAVSLTGGRPRVLDLFERFDPHLVEARGEGRRVRAAINITEDRAVLEVEAGSGSDPWGGPARARWDDTLVVGPRSATRLIDEG